MLKLNETQRSNDPKTKWLLVDIGNVLILKDRTYTFTELLANELDVTIDLAQQINKAHYSVMDVKYIPEEEFSADLEKNLGYKAPKNIFSYFAKAYEKQAHPNIELLEFLAEMRAIGIKTAVLSNTIAIYHDAHQKTGISKKNGFDPILYSWQVKMLKPNNDIFELALDRLKSKPEEIIFIDDKLGHIQGAKQVGMRTILFENTDNTISKIRESLR